MIQRAGDAHPGGIGTGLVDEERDLVVGAPELELGDDRLSIDLGEHRQCGLIPLEELVAHGRFEGRGLVRGGAIGQLLPARPRIESTDLVADTIQHRATQIGLERPLAALLEMLESS